MAKTSRTPIDAAPPPQPKTPKTYPVITHGYLPDWDLRAVPSSALVAELVRRGECPTLQPAPAGKAAPVKGKAAARSPSLFG